METERFDKIKRNMGPSIRMKLETIRKNLHDNKAACLVGAGFSKNADMDEGTYMKDWAELGADFYQSLFCVDPKPEDLKFKSVLRLASQVEAVKGRAALEALIQNALPNAHIFPGSLHVNLMKLPWNDVFTTNYDTLLEKSCIEADRYYYTVTNKETLLYTPRPRIIKLHGSFPDIRPFVITEEDFRTYPQRFPEFVNTVRQSLIENVLCLIGFSGDDPNFLSWLGWLRDVMGKQASPVYQITYEPRMHDSHMMLSYELGISIVNLAEIDGLQDYSEALDFLMQYLSEEYKSHWSGELKHISVLQEYDMNILELTQEMSIVRHSYPGWYLLPSSHINDFDDIKTFFPFYGIRVDEAKLSISSLVNFLFELDWRIEISCSSRNIDWYLNALEKLPIDMSGEITKDEYKKILSLKLSLLSHYRTHLVWDKYLVLKDNLFNRQKRFSYEQMRIFMYQCCLYEISMLNFVSVEKLLDQWKLSPMDYLGTLWKSGILQELGHKQEAESLLKESLMTVKKNILGDAYSPLLISARSAIEFKIWYLDIKNIKRPKTNEDFDFYDVLNHYRDKINKSQEKPENIRYTHDFQLFSTGQQWNFFESGFVTDYIYSYRYFKAYERLGIPIGNVNGISMDIEVKKHMLDCLIKDELLYSLSLIIKCDNYKLLKHVIGRNVMRTISKKQALLVYDKYFTICELCLNNETSKILRNRTLSVLLPMLTRFSTKLPNDYIKSLFRLWIEVYNKYPTYYEHSMLSILYDNISGQEYLECSQMALETPIQDVEIRRDIVLPDRKLKQILVSQKAISIITEALGNSNKVIVNYANDRLNKIVACQLTDSQKEQLNQAVVLWRAAQPITKQKILSFFAVPCVEKETALFEQLKNDKLDSFMKYEFYNIHSSQPIDEFSEGMIELQPFFKCFSEQEHLLFVAKIIQFLVNNEERYKNADSKELLGGLHSKVSVIFNVLSYYSNMESLPAQENDIWNELLQILIRYRKYDYPVMLIIAHLAFLLKIDKTKLKNMIEGILFGNNDVLIKDSVSAYIYMAEKQKKHINQTILKRVMSSLSYSCTERTKSYFRLLIYVLREGSVSTEARIQLINFMNSYIETLFSFSIDEELRSDVMFFANILAGEMSILVHEWNGLADWKINMNSDFMFNDEKNGFEIGESNVTTR